MTNKEKLIMANRHIPLRDIDLMLSTRHMSDDEPMELYNTTKREERAE